MFNPKFAKFRRKKITSTEPVLSNKHGQRKISNFFTSQQKLNPSTEVFKSDTEHDSDSSAAKKRKTEEDGPAALSSTTKERIGQFSAAVTREDNVGIIHTIPRKEKSEPPPASGSSSSQESSRSKLSPLEVQVTELKSKHPGMILMIQNAYKYCFYGEDAEIASKILHIAAVPHRNFVIASIPIHRLQVHARRLVKEGYKVGVVKQTETAALKAVSDSKNAVFARELSFICSKATLVGDDVNPLVQDRDMLPDEGKAAFLLCVAEKGEALGRASLGIVAFDAGTGETYYDAFEDGPNREELEKRLAHLMPTEIVTSESLTTETETLLKYSSIQLERLSNEEFDFSSSLLRVATFLAMADSSHAQALSELPPPVVCALSALLQHLKKYGLHQALQPQGLRNFTSRTRFLQMDASVLRNLEILQTADGMHRGSLLWLLDHAHTKFGSRLLREWVSQPLRDKTALEERQDAVTELLRSPSETIRLIRALLTGLPDIDRGLTTILHNRCNPCSLCVVLQCLGRLHRDLESVMGVAELELTSPLLSRLMSDTVQLLGNIQHFLCNLDQEAAKQGDVTHFLRDYSDFPQVTERQTQVAEVTRKLDELRPAIARRLGMFRVDYMTVSGQEYLVEVRQKQPVPTNWRMVSQTKQCTRYRTPEVDELFSELCRLREKLKGDCQAAWVDFMAAFNQHYLDHKKAVRNLATLDALLSLTQVAQSPGYCRPLLIESEDTTIHIKQGRHPIVSALSTTDSFVPNDTELQNSKRCCMVLSGPNMGGKSCYIRQVALITVMAHVGSYVPAESATVSILDTIFTRMGARDELFEGRSTLLLELQEAASVLSQATPRSLALLDELGRGTSSCDGAAIAVTTLHHLISEVRCLTLYVTHYPSVMQVAPKLNYHMGFLLHQPDGETEEQLVFLYEVVAGAADRSYGLNVARLAGVPAPLLHVSANKAAQLEQGVRKRSQLREDFLHYWRDAGLDHEAGEDIE